MRVLITDDERNIRESLKKYLSLEGITARCAETGEEALRFLEWESFDAVILDLKLPGMDGQEVLLRIRDRGVSVPVLMISAHGQISDAVEALKAGARDYLVKPFDPAELLIKLRQLVDDKRRENLVEAEKRLTGPGGLIGEAEAMRRVSAKIRKVAASTATVLITGESGTGKEVAAREIHRLSPQASDPFVAVNIGGIHEGLMESELFGHEKGAFTGASARKQGLFELAGRGVIFLDEIGEMPAPLQVKLLRVLQERKIRRLGGSADIPVGARIVSATNRNLEALVKDGRFREDLYYRINVFRLILPPLRERREDLPLLTEHLLHKLSVRMNRPVPSLSTAAAEKLRGYSFPGNIRELENILERALIYAGETEIRPEDIDIHRDAGFLGGPPGDGPGSAAGSSGISSSASLEELEKQAVQEALVRCGGNRTKAAQELGISRKTILNKIKAYGWDPIHYKVP
ncbi:MAG: sigma-54 dependent transcriptional regulator [Spirochaetaceae bacterium]|jgi:two-component system response regulator AtoC|nr:sigma-54 dependent transcriptional regulator [Spirochaetaceae bacterium]